ncbi:DUF1304 domain-containing protein [Bdellovibrio sp.]|uniref:DUF1304 domain-containing protein n=1 Tax=Bdellovibrio sp. TaxID=28201 RepID=UPI0039E69C2B
MLGNILVVLVAVLHLAFLYLEMFLWTKPLGRKIFRNTPQKAEDSAILAANQGLYNGFLSAGLLWGVFHPDVMVGDQIKFFFLICVIVAGLYGALSVSKRIFYIQALPALLALIVTFMLKTWP